MNNKYRIVLFVLFILVVLSFVTTQLTNDFRPFWAYGRFVSNSEESGINALIDTWEMKGLLFKSYLYVEYAITSLFSISFDAYGQTIYKIIGIIPFWGLLWLSVFSFPKRYLSGCEKKDVFLILSLLLLSVHFASHYQAEMWGVLFMFFSFSLYLHDGWKTKVAAAFVYFITFYLKSPIPLLGGSIVAASVLLKKHNIKEGLRDLIPFALASAFFLSLSLSLLYVFYTQEIYDIWNASYYQKTLLHEPERVISSLIHLVYMMIKTILYNPINGVGILAAIIVFMKFVKNKEWSHIFYLFLVWAFPLAYVLISNCFFVYHYYLLAFSAVLSLIVLVNSGIYIKKKKILYLSSAFVLYYLFALSSVCPTNLFERRTYAEFCNEIEEKENVTVGCNLGEGDIMFLDDGTGAFFFSNKSYLRYFYPLPLQRVKKSDAFANMPTHILTKQKAMEFDGEYITLQKEWFLSGGNNYDILNKIHNEYDLYKKITYSEYSWTLFKNTNSIDTLFVYKKK